MVQSISNWHSQFKKKNDAGAVWMLHFLMPNSVQDDLAQILTREQGKTIEDAKGDIFRGLEVCHFSHG